MQNPLCNGFCIQVLNILRKYLLPGYEVGKTDMVHLDEVFSCEEREGRDLVNDDCRTVEDCGLQSGAARSHQGHVRAGQRFVRGALEKVYIPRVFGERLNNTTINVLSNWQKNSHVIKLVMEPADHLKQYRHVSDYFVFSAARHNRNDRCPAGQAHLLKKAISRLCRLYGRHKGMADIDRRNSVLVVECLFKGEDGDNQFYVSLYLPDPCSPPCPNLGRYEIDNGNAQFFCHRGYSQVEPWKIDEDEQ